MRFSEILAASTLVAAPLAAAHADTPHAPKIFGLGPNPIQKLKSRNFAGPAARRVVVPYHAPRLNRRQGGVDGQCGPSAGGASCDPGYCCSSAGWCGTGEEYCAAPDCLFQYGPGCDANKVPNGADTRNIARPQLGSIAYGGEGVYHCSVPGTVAITYDDGPFIYTNNVLDQFKAYGFKATFFITGNNNGKGAIDDASTQWPAIISRMIAEGHQVASHTWSHQDLSAITKEQRITQMVRNEMAIRNIIQKFPTYMRPPYSSCTAESGCQADLKSLGYVVSYFDLDTDDYNNVTPDLIQNAKDNFAEAINPSNPTTNDFLAIGHDIHQQTAQNLTGYMLDLLVKKGYRGVTMGECLGDPAANWYRNSAGTIVSSSSATPSATQPSSSTLTPPTATPSVVSQDGSCGGAKGYTCIGFSEGSCCSQYGWCGSSADHCGTGCNPFFGTCGSSSSSTPSASAPASSTSAAPTGKPTGPTSTDGSCGGAKGYSCIGFADGECCSQYGWCGKSVDHCGTGCNPLFGNCGNAVGSSSSSSSSSSPASPSTPASSPSPSSVKPSSASSSPAPLSSNRPASTIATSVRPSSTTAKASATPSPTAKVSTNGRCGKSFGGTTCKGYKDRWGRSADCCGWDGTCGNGVLACGMGCQSSYGTCWW